VSPPNVLEHRAVVCSPFTQGMAGILLPRVMDGVGEIQLAGRVSGSRGLDRQVPARSCRPRVLSIIRGVRRCRVIPRAGEPCDGANDHNSQCFRHTRGCFRPWTECDLAVARPGRVRTMVALVRRSFHKFHRPRRTGSATVEVEKSWGGVGIVGKSGENERGGAEAMGGGFWKKREG